MVNVDEQYQVDARGRQLRVGQGAQHGSTFVIFFSALRLLDEVEHLLLNVHGEDLALGADAPGHAEGVVAAAGADVGDHVARFELERFEQLSQCSSFSRSGRSSQPAAW